MIDALYTQLPACHRQQGKCGRTDPDEPFPEIEMVLCVEVVRHGSMVGLAIFPDLDLGQALELASCADVSLLYLPTIFV